MEELRVEERDRILVLTLNRPERKNALTRAMYRGLCDTLDQFRDDDTFRVLLLRGAGDAFTAGNDLRDFMDDASMSSESPVLGFLRRLVELDKPLVVSVHGAAVGIGTTLLLHADLVYAAEDASFCMPFVPLGLVPEGGSSFLLPRALGHRRAAELLLLGENFSALTAMELGLVNAIADPVEEHALSRAQALARQALPALKASKRLLKAPYREELLDVIAREGEIFAERLRSPEAIEAFQAFFEKRKPKF